MLPGYAPPPAELQAAAEGIGGGLNRALAAAGHPSLRCALSLVDGTTVVTHLVGRLDTEEARGRVGSWAAGDAAFMITAPLKLVGATAWEAHYNGAPIVRLPVI
ncbi:hypothetical protein GCM10009850_046740 [Nonomuraea monospora]|uniref:Uncharacterized protein n=1 Tax=Nonomuraea monospora TaxID=568818 RepID=A0ABP5PBT0_9ACTN